MGSRSHGGDRGPRSSQGGGQKCRGVPGTSEDGCGEAAPRVQVPSAAGRHSTEDRQQLPHDAGRGFLPRVAPSDTTRTPVALKRGLGLAVRAANGDFLRGTGTARALVLCRYRGQYIRGTAKIQAGVLYMRYEDSEARHADSARLPRGHSGFLHRLG